MNDLDPTGHDDAQNADLYFQALSDFVDARADGYAVQPAANRSRTVTTVRPALRLVPVASRRRAA